MSGSSKKHEMSRETRDIHETSWTTPQSMTRGEGADVTNVNVCQRPAFKRRQ